MASPSQAETRRLTAQASALARNVEAMAQSVPFNCFRSEFAICVISGTVIVIPVVSLHGPQRRVERWTRRSPLSGFSACAGGLSSPFQAPEELEDRGCGQCQEMLGRWPVSRFCFSVKYYPSVGEARLPQVDSGRPPE